MSKRNCAIDLLRFIFCLVILCDHSELFAGDQVPLFQGGYIGVEFFFIVSGFLMAASAERAEQSPSRSITEDTVSFLRRKLGAILPYYLFAFLLAFFIRQIALAAAPAEIAKDAFYALPELLLLKRLGIGNGRWYNGATWYLSSMFFAMLILYPILRKKRDFFCRILSPVLAVVFLYLRLLEGNGGFVFDLNVRSLFRAIAEICIGCTGYAVCCSMKQKTYTRFGTFFLSILELGGYAVVLIMAFLFKIEAFDSYLLIFLAVSVPVTFSGKSVTGALNAGSGKWQRFCGWLGKFSLVLYLNHRYWSFALREWMAGWDYWSILPVYFLLALVSSLACLWIVDSLKKRVPWGRLIHAKAQ